jgi:DNA topoisomerase VI subunit A
MSDRKIDYQGSPEKRYPNYKTESGWDCKTVEITLKKPHGLQELMKQIIREVQKGAKRFAPLSKKLSTDNSYADILRAIDIMVIDGILQTSSKNKRPNKSDLEWELQIICLDPRVQKQASAKEKLQTDQYEKLRSKIKEIIQHIGDSSLKLHLMQCIYKKELSSPDGKEICNSQAWVKFQSIALTLSYALVLIDEDRREPLRVISERIWGKSKILDRYKKDIVLVTGKSLNQLNLTTTAEVTYVYGDVTYIHKGYRSSFLAGSPYSLTEGTISSLEIEHVGVNKIFIIENLAVFQEAFVREYQERPDVLLMWGAGYISSIKMRLLKKILQSKPIPVYIWSDLDSDGLGLTFDIMKKVRKYGVNACPVLMSARELDLTKGEYKASNHHGLNDPEIFAVFPDVIERIRLNNVMEQEELLLHYDLFKHELP